MRSPKGARIRAIHYGVGSIGAEVVRLVLEQPHIDSVSAIDPAKAGRDLGEVAGLDRRLGSTIAYDPEQVLSGVDADVVLHTGVPGLTAAYPQIAQAVAAGKNVISDCAELVFPWLRHPDISQRLDRLARESGVAVLGTGANLGFVMATLPLLLATACHQISAVRVTRVADVAPRALELRDTVGLGLSPEGFRQLLGSRGTGLPGLRESLLMIAHTLSWPLDDISETVEPVLARNRLRTDYYVVGKGYVQGLRHVVSGVMAGRQVLRLGLELSLSPENPRDEIDIDGKPPIKLSIPGGLPGQLSTAAIMINCIPAVVRNEVSGLLSMRDLPVAPYRFAGAPLPVDSDE